MITLKYQSLKVSSMSWKLKCQDCKNRHDGHLWPSWAGHMTWWHLTRPHHSHSDPVTRWITVGHFSPAPSSERPMGQSRGQGATSTRQQLSEEQGAPREAWSCPVDTGTVKMWQGYNESCVNMSVASSLWSESEAPALSWTTTTVLRGRGRPQVPPAEDMSGKASLKVAEKKIQNQSYVTSYCSEWW